MRRLSIFRDERLLQKLARVNVTYSLVILFGEMQHEECSSQSRTTSFVKISKIQTHSDKLMMTTYSQMEDDPEAIPESEFIISEVNSARLKSGLGVVRDALNGAHPAIKAGFGVAKASTAAGFGMGQSFLETNAQVADSIGVHGAFSSSFRAFSAILGLAHAITTVSLEISEQISSESVIATDSLLENTGVQRGESVRILESYVENQRGLNGYETKSALLCVAKLLGELSPLLEVQNPLKLRSGAQSLAHSQRMHRLQRMELMEHKDIVNEMDPLMARSLERYMKFSFATYGSEALLLFSATKKIVRTDKEGITELTGVPARRIVHHVRKGQMFRPGHYVAVDAIHRQVVVAIRGTMRVQDVLVDLVCEQDDFIGIWDHDEVRHGKAHKGFLIAAQRLAGELHEPVAEALRQHPGFELVITGHSMGAATATLLALLWARVREFRDRNIHAYAFAAPCTLCPELAQAPFTKRHVTSVVCGDDIVSRLSLSNVKDMQRGMVTMAPLEYISNIEKVELYKDLPREDVKHKLFCAGRVWLLEAEEFGMVPVEVDPIETLNCIQLTSGMFSSHMPHQYMQVVSKLATQM